MILHICESKLSLLTKNQVRIENIQELKFIKHISFIQLRSQNLV